jgi:hypothetical protein
LNTDYIENVKKAFLERYSFNTTMRVFSSMAAVENRLFTIKLKKEEKIMGKKVFIKPELTIHGDIEKITLSGTLVNSDVPKGNANTAECVKGTPGCIS